MKKLILVTPGIRFNPMGVPVLSVNGTYMNGIAAAGGIPVMLGSTPLAEEYAEMAAGLVITGGESVHPTRYGETFMHLADNDPAIAHNLKAGCNSVRDEMEFAAFEAFFRRKKPILGICRGLQAMNVILGGGLYQDIPKQRPSDVDHHMDAPYGRTAHPIRMAEGSPLAECLGTVETGVNSCHHQAVRTLAPRLKSMAEAPDGVIEAVYMPDRRFVWAVQWHPEFYDNTPDSLKIFEAFIKSC